MPFSALCSGPCCGCLSATKTPDNYHSPLDRQTDRQCPISLLLFATKPFQRLFITTCPESLSFCSILNSSTMPTKVVFVKTSIGMNTDEYDDWLSALECTTTPGTPPGTTVSLHLPSEIPRLWVTPLCMMTIVSFADSLSPEQPIKCFRVPSSVFHLPLSIYIRFSQDRRY